MIFSRYIQKSKKYEILHYKLEDLFLQKIRKYNNEEITENLVMMKNTCIFISLDLLLYIKIITFYTNRIRNFSKICFSQNLRIKKLAVVFFYKKLISNHTQKLQKIFHQKSTQNWSKINYFLDYSRRKILNQIWFFTYLIKFYCYNVKSENVANMIMHIFFFY